MRAYDPFRQPIIDELLNRQWLREVHWYPSIDSTNTAARRLIELGSLQLPALIVADRQTAGRGRSDHVWWSPDGCLMLTLVIPSELLPDHPGDWNQLALVCGVAVADTVEAVIGANLSGSQCLCQLKWPNDVYLSGRKVAGMLIESIRLPDSPTAWLIGIGLNVDMDWERAPMELATRATCLKRETTQAQSPEVVLVELIEQLENWLKGWSCGERHWHEGWRDRCLLTGKILQVRFSHARVDSHASKTMVGRCAGLDPQGRLLIGTEQGMRSLAAGEVIDWQ